MKDFRELKVWEKSHLLALDIYKLTSGFPKIKINQHYLNFHIYTAC